MNRAERRSSVSKQRMGSVAKNGRTPAAMPSSAGALRRTLDQPEQVGSISVAEAAEIRERKRLREKYETDFQAKQDELGDIAKVITLLRVENEQYLQKLLRERSLSAANDYNVQSESGIIWCTAVPASAEDVHIEETEEIPALAAVASDEGD